MRRLPRVIVLSVAFCVAGFPAGAAWAARNPGGSATLSWYPPTANADGSALGNLAGYRIYYGTSAQRLNRTIVIDNPGLTRYVVENLSSSKWHFAMTSYNADGKESERSVTVSKKVN